MLFDTSAYGLFLVLAFTVFWSLRRRRTIRRVSLLAASYYFYACWNVAYLGLILFSTLLDYTLGRAIHAETRPGRRKALLALSLAGNLGVLATFKYLNFFAANLNLLAGLFGLGPLVPLIDLLLPVGISFYTFQTLSYTIEIYQGKTAPRSSFVDFALFVSFFPQLVAGPIVRASEFLPQLDGPRRLSEGRVGLALFLIQKGLFKKVVLADFIAQNLVDPVFADPAAFGGLTVLLAIYGFKLQIYGDFSGYSDMAIGSARLFGFELPVNFRSPYKATSIPDYWRRWHITLGAWIRDFVFYPLGGTRCGRLRGTVNLLAAMTLVGLWHGASWTFVAWGTYYGVLLVLTRALWKPWESVRDHFRPGLLTALGWLLTFHLTSFAGLLIRADSIADVPVLLSRLLSFGGASQVSGGCLLVLVVGYATHFWPERGKTRIAEAYPRWRPVAQAATLTALIALVVMLQLRENPFFYFQF